MTRTERLRRSGSAVSDWTKPVAFMERAHRDIKKRFDAFLEKHTLFRGTCFFEKSGLPKISVSFWRVASHEYPARVPISDGDKTLLIGIMGSLQRARRNLTVVQTNINFLSPVFEIKIRDYYPFMDKQPELDLFSPFGGNASAPDRTRKSRKPPKVFVKWEDDVAPESS